MLSVTVQPPVYETVTVIMSPSDRSAPLTVREFEAVGEPSRSIATGVDVLDLLQ